MIRRVSALTGLALRYDRAQSTAAFEEVRDLLLVGCRSNAPQDAQASACHILGEFT